MDNFQGALLLTVIVLVLAACAAAPSDASPSPTASSACPTVADPLPHQAPDLEAVLPADVQGRPLATWSLAGVCWPAYGSDLGPTELAEVLREEMQPNGEAFDFGSLAFAVAGRSDVDVDPPYFVFGAVRPYSEDATSLALVLMFTNAGFHDPIAAADLDAYETRTLDGKTVYVGSTEALRQDNHQRGRPWLYQNDDYMFLVLTDDDAWAGEALAALP